MYGALDGRPPPPYDDRQPGDLNGQRRTADVAYSLTFLFFRPCAKSHGPKAGTRSVRASHATCGDFREKGARIVILPCTPLHG